LLWVFIFLLVAAGVAAATVYFIEERNRQKQVAVADKTPPPPVPAVPDKKPPPPKQIEINLVSVPLGAEVFRADDPEEKTLGVTPFKARFPAGDATINLIFRLEGYKQHTVSLEMKDNTGYLAEMVSLRAKKRRGSKKPVGKKPTDTKKKVDKTHTLDPFAR